MSLYGNYINESYEDEFLTESVESELKKSSSIDNFLSRFKLSRKDVDVAKKFITNNGLMSKLKKCKSIKDIKNFMNSKEYKEALEKENK